MDAMIARRCYAVKAVQGVAVDGVAGEYLVDHVEQTIEVLDTGEPRGLLIARSVRAGIAACLDALPAARNPFGGDIEVLPVDHLRSSIPVLPNDPTTDDDE